ncbi:MAG TPA: type II toxin-antitoxin system RelE/ParE family toxin [Gemmataceae bacterium]|nr:type II toxin-antitoxin system RelE/ParE family toxin [Gemmataceae bacterium]
MRLSVRFRTAAKAEYEAAVAWYDEARPGLGEDFETEVQSVLDEASTNPKRYPIADGDVREAPVSGFPYCIYYRVRSGKLVVVAVYHQSRDPGGWRGRV